MKFKRQFILINQGEDYQETITNGIIIFQSSPMKFVSKWVMLPSSTTELREGSVYKVCRFHPKFRLAYMHSMVYMFRK